MGWRLFLDVDGVLCDFSRAALRTHGLAPGDYYSDPSLWPGTLGEPDLYRATRTDEAGFWARLLNERWWADLLPTPDAMQILAACEAVHPPGGVHLLSSPHPFPPCWAGRLAWMRRMPGTYGRRATLATLKRVHAHPGALLIDDKDEEVDAWRDHGGWAILLPRAWNRRHAEAGDAVACLRRDLERAVLGMTMKGVR